MMLQFSCMSLSFTNIQGDFELNSKTEGLALLYCQMSNAHFFQQFHLSVMEAYSDW